MSINLIRSPRKTDFWRIQTPQAVGPGVYSANQSFVDVTKEK